MYLQTIGGSEVVKQNTNPDGSTRLEPHSSLGNHLRNQAKFTVRLAFHVMGFQVTEEFLESWVKLSPVGRVGTTEQFRKAFCEGNHYEFEWKSKSSSKTYKLNAAEVWGLIVVYSFHGDKRLLRGIQTKDWLLQFVGASIRRPPFSVCNVPFGPVPWSNAFLDLTIEMMRKQTGLSREEIDRLIRAELSKTEQGRKTLKKMEAR